MFKVTYLINGAVCYSAVDFRDLKTMRESFEVISVEFI